MNKFDLARRLARKSHRSRGQAADQVDTLVYEILKDLKQGKNKPARKAEEHGSALPASVSKEKQ